jgi:hypothetical protein
VRPSRRAPHQPRSTATTKRSTRPVRTPRSRARPLRRREIVLLGALLAAYDLIRLGASNGVAPTVGHARDLLGLERFLGLDVEGWLNRHLVGARWPEMTAAYWYAALHYLVTPLAPTRAVG